MFAGASAASNSALTIDPCFDLCCRLAPSLRKADTSASWRMRLLALGVDSATPSICRLRPGLRPCFVTSLRVAACSAS
ncbi:hypothetical protein K438DRAFT_1839534 [Mycena galopus ATCC 62051]|nr:hypothetical protein K438DRAFT_1839534 [Mycena galopus ATCC 62051]